MQRREFNKVAGALAASTMVPLAGQAQTTMGATPSAGAVAMGTNLSGMEWAKPGLRYGASTLPNLNFTVPRKVDVAYLAGQGFTKNRLPIQWELLQPMLFDTAANAATIALVGAPGAFHAGYESYITGVLDAHAAVGMKCIIDLHNYCRYQDFVYQPDGSVKGLRTGSSPLVRPYTTDASQVQVRIFALANGTTLRQAHFLDFWQRAASKWKGHPGLGGYGLMNEPHDLPRPGTTVASTGGEDLTIWPTYAQAAIKAIRAIDASTPIYVAGNGWDSAMAIATKNPGFPLAGANLIYEVHMYLDAASNGARFDYDVEVAKNFSAGFGGVPIHLNTGLERIKMATDWAAAKGVKLALTEIGMPVDDTRWEAMFKLAVNHARSTGCEIYTWMGGNHWPIHNYGINHVPGWHQNRTLEPSVAGPLLASAAIAKAALFDDGPGYAPAGTPVTITVYARGNLSAPVRIGVKSSNGGLLSKTQLVIPAGPNGSDTFTFTPAANRIATLSYSSDGQLSGQVPPPRKVYSLADPVLHSKTDLAEAALCIIGKYSACKWDMNHGYTDYMLGAPATDGQNVRAISDSGYGSSAGNAMQMINWINKDSSNMGTMAVPVMRVTNGKKNSDHSVANTFGFWCKKRDSMPGLQANPKNRVPYNVEDAHFAIAVVSVPGLANSGVVFQASKAEALHTSDLGFTNSQPHARWLDSSGKTVQLTSPTRLVANTPAVIALTSAPGAQKLRVNSAVVASGSASFAASSCSQMLIGWGFRGFYPQDSFRGNVYGVIAGKGSPTPAELAVLEAYLARDAGAAPAPVAPTPDDSAEADAPAGAYAAWVGSKKYVPGNIVSRLGKNYICIANSENSPPEWTSKHWSIYAAAGTATGAAPSVAVAAWVGTKKYVPGNIVSRLGKIYICIANSENSPPEWTSKHWSIQSGMAV